jgi:phosphoglycolate phosphatase
MARILLFDYDGVLVDSLDIFMNHFISACHKEGFSQIHDKKSFLHLFNKNLYESMLEIGMDLEVILRVVHQVRDGLFKDQHNLKLFPGIHEMIEYLAQYNELFVVTSNESKVVDSFLQSQRIYDFSGIYGSDNGGSKVNKINSIKKQYPDADFYYIGDTIGDIDEGRKANVKTVAVTWGWHDASELASNKPDYLIDAPKKLIKIIDQ